MTQLPNTTKYTVTDALIQLAEGHLEDVLIAKELDLLELEVHRIDRLVFNVRIKPNGGGVPRYITVKVSESW